MTTINGSIIDKLYYTEEEIILNGSYIYFLYVNRNSGIL